MRKLHFRKESLKDVTLDLGPYKIKYRICAIGKDK